ncbi:hypothetical protein B0H13DRAFT_2518182 [Mycena leptocephala]|nr:hypothetical protein B0H13DRAFT_2518182 [Mycena leptocephala]
MEYILARAMLLYAWLGGEALATRTSHSQIRFGPMHRGVLALDVLLRSMGARLWAPIDTASGTGAVAPVWGRDVDVSGRGETCVSLEVGSGVVGRGRRAQVERRTRPTSDPRSFFQCLVLDFESREVERSRVSLLRDSMLGATGGRGMLGYPWVRAAVDAYFGPAAREVHSMGDGAVEGMVRRCEAHVICVCMHSGEDVYVPVPPFVAFSWTLLSRSIHPYSLREEILFVQSKKRISPWSNHLVRPRKQNTGDNSDQNDSDSESEDSDDDDPEDESEDNGAPSSGYRNERGTSGSSSPSPLAELTYAGGAPGLKENASQQYQFGPYGAVYASLYPSHS